MKKIFLIILVLITLSGCFKSEEKIENKTNNKINNTSIISTTGSIINKNRDDIIKLDNNISSLKKDLSKDLNNESLKNQINDLEKEKSEKLDIINKYRPKLEHKKIDLNSPENKDILSNLSKEDKILFSNIEKAQNKGDEKELKKLIGEARKNISKKVTELLNARKIGNKDLELSISKEIGYYRVIGL